MVNIIYVRIPDRHWQVISINDTIMRYYESIEGITVYWIEKTHEIDSLLTNMDPKYTILFWGAHYIQALKYKNFFHVGQLGDHPFANWIKPRLQNLTNNIFLTYIEEGYSNAIKLISPNYKSHCLIQGHISDSPFPDHQDKQKKEIDYIIAMNLRKDYANVYSELILSKKSKHLPYYIYNQLLDSSINNTSEYIIDTFQSLLRSNGLDWNTFIPEAREESFYFIHHIDMYIRHSRRVALIKKIIKSTSYSKRKILAITDPHIYIPGTEVINLKFLTYPRYLSALKKSKLHIFSSPTYPNVIDHRVVASAYASCAIYCDKNAAMTKNNIISLDDINPIPVQNDIDIICQANIQTLNIHNKYQDHLLLEILKAHTEFTLGK